MCLVFWNSFCQQCQCVYLYMYMCVPAPKTPRNWSCKCINKQDRHLHINTKIEYWILRTQRYRWIVSSIRAKTRRCRMKLVPEPATTILNNRKGTNKSIEQLTWSFSCNMDLKAVSCRIEWSLFQVCSLNHSQVILFIMNFLSQSHCSGPSASKR